MKYNIIDIIDDNIKEDDLKRIINKKIYNIINFMEFNTFIIENN